MYIFVVVVFFFFLIDGNKYRPCLHRRLATMINYTYRNCHPKDDRSRVTRDVVAVMFWPTDAVGLCLRWYHFAGTSDWRFPAFEENKNPFLSPECVINFIWNVVRFVERSNKELAYFERETWTLIVDCRHNIILFSRVWKNNTLV